MLDKQDVTHIARLARLDLSDGELDKYSKQLSAVLELFKKLDDLDLSSTEETSQVTGLVNVFKSDEIKKYPDLTDCKTDELIASAPIHNQNEMRVPKVIGDN